MENKEEEFEDIKIIKINPLSKILKPGEPIFWPTKIVSLDELKKEFPDERK